MTVLRVDTIAGIGQTFGPLLDGDLEFNSQNYIVLPKGSSNQQGVLRTTEDVIGVGGTHYDNLVLAMPFNEATGFRDVSSRNRNPGAYGNVSISSTISKYYGSSVGLSSASSQYLDAIEGSNNFDFEGDFTLEFWIYFSKINLYQDITGTATNSVFLGSGKGGWVAAYYTTPDNEFRFSYQNNSSWTFQTAFDFNASVDTWYHVAYAREGSNLRCFVNGTQAQSTISTVGILTSTEGFIRVGGGYGSTSGLFDGHLQDLRIYKGIAKYTADFTPPERIAETGVGFKTGALRYNTDSNKPELYDGNQWTELQISNVGLGTGGDTGPGARGVFQGGLTPSESSTVDYINISSTGNAISFGNLSSNRRLGAAFASSTRVFSVGGFDGSSDTNEIEYFTIASTGSRVDFGSNLSSAIRSNAGAANATRGLSLGGTAPKSNEIDYITMASDGSSVGSFGVPIMSPGTAIVQAYGTASPTRAIFGGGETPVRVNTIQFVTISTLGNAQDFGDLTAAVSGVAAFGNATRGIFGGGEISPDFLSTMQSVNFASTGNAVTFGELIQGSGGLRQSGSASSPTRGVFAGGSNDTPAASTVYNQIQYVEIATEGNAVDFGDLVSGTARWQIMNGTTSNAHGGL